MEGLQLISGVLWLFIVLAVVWSMAWKGVALWRAGRNGHPAWFIVMFIINTLGILEIVYIFAFSRKKAE
jgi:methionyl-tRNA synthetase